MLLFVGTVIVMLAARKEIMEAVRLQLEAGSDINYKSNTCETFLTLTINKKLHSVSLIVAYATGETTLTCFASLYKNKNKPL